MLGEAVSKVVSEAASEGVSEEVGVALDEEAAFVETEGEDVGSEGAGVTVASPLGLCVGVPLATKPNVTEVVADAAAEHDMLAVKDGRGVLLGIKPKLTDVDGDLEDEGDELGDMVAKAVCEEVGDAVGITLGVSAVLAPKLREGETVRDGE